MVQKVVTKKSFIGGRLVYPGEMVDVDAKGVVLPAGSTPVGAMSIAQLRATLEAREAVEGKAPAPEPEFGDNLADPVKGNTGTQELEIARIAPGSGNRPQGIPPGTEEHNNSFVHPAPAAAPAAIEEVVGAPATVPDPAQGNISAAIELLDPANDEHWTNAGLPSVEAVTELVGTKVSRAEINAAAPAFMRPAVDNDDV